MADTIKIQLQDIYEPITEEQIRQEKNFVLRREQAANGIAALVDALLSDAAEKITRICYNYGIDPEQFRLSPDYNEKMFGEVAEVLNDLEDDIMSLIETYSAKCTKDKNKKVALMIWILSLGNRSDTLMKILERRLQAFALDLEAMIAAARTAGLNVAKAVTLIRSRLHTAYQMPGMQQAFTRASAYKARNIRTRGVKKGNRGSSNSEANNIIRFTKTTVQKAWMRYRRQLYEENGAIGYYVLRGSTFPCSICDSMTGFHLITDTDGYPIYHANCQCYTVPVFERDITELME